MKPTMADCHEHIFTMPIRLPEKCRKAAQFVPERTEISARQHIEPATPLACRNSIMRKITIALVSFPGFQLLDIAGPSDAFAEVRILSGGTVGYELFVIGTTRGPIRSSSGLTITPDRTIFDPCPQFDTVLFPGGLGVFDLLEDSTLISWLIRQSKSCRRLGAVCNGAFAFGAAGLLNGRTVTTHWMDADRLTSMFPKARVESDRIYVKDDFLYTTAGVTAGIDLSLLLIEEDFGRKMAVDVAKYLIVYLRRAGDQAQFSPLLEMQADGNSKVARIQQYIQNNLHMDLDPVMIGRSLNMSSRNLSRVFTKETGVTLIAFVNDARIGAAQRYLENGEMQMKEIANRCGFKNAESMRRLFVRRLGISPVDYRRRFRTAARPTESESPALNRLLAE
jgi:transcriptional regulator GlxA family with amidase domain